MIIGENAIADQIALFTHVKTILLAKKLSIFTSVVDNKHNEVYVNKSEQIILN